MALPRFASILNRRTAIPVALAIWVLASTGDYVTTAYVGFTILYLIPISIAVWWKGIRVGLFFCALCIVSYVTTWVGTTQIDFGARYLLILMWNLAGEVGVYLTFAIVLHHLRTRLFVEVKQRESAVVQLRHADRLNTVGKLAAGIAHELGTPLNVVAGWASLIASGKITGEAACKYAKVIEQQTERMTAIIKNLLAFARRGGARKADVDVGTLVRETVTLLEPLARKRNVEIVVESDAPHVAPVNAGELQQVLTNLVMNAVQAMPQGGKVCVQVEEGRGRQGTEFGQGADTFVYVRVRDQGTGIAPEVLPHIFDPFFTTKDVGSGTGLGLSVTYGIIRDHGGWIEVDTVPGKGTEFVVYVPQKDTAPNSAPWLDVSHAD